MLADVLAAWHPARYLELLVCLTGVQSSCWMRWLCHQRAASRCTSTANMLAAPLHSTEHSCGRTMQSTGDCQVRAAVACLGKMTIRP